MRTFIPCLCGVAAVLTACGGETDPSFPPSNADSRPLRALVQAISDQTPRTTTVHVDLWSKDDRTEKWSSLALAEGEELVAVFPDGSERMFFASEQGFAASRDAALGSPRVVLRRGDAERLVGAVDMPDTVLHVPETVRFGEPLRIRLDPPPAAGLDVQAVASGACVRRNNGVRFDDDGVATFTAFGDENGEPACAIRFDVQIVGQTGKAPTSLSRAETLWAVRRFATTAAYR